MKAASSEWYKTTTTSRHALPPLPLSPLSSSSGRSIKGLHRSQNRHHAFYHHTHLPSETDEFSTSSNSRSKIYGGGSSSNDASSKSPYRTHSSSHSQSESVRGGVSESGGGASVVGHGERRRRRSYKSTPTTLSSFTSSTSSSYFITGDREKYKDRIASVYPSLPSPHLSYSNRDSFARFPFAPASPNRTNTLSSDRRLFVSESEASETEAGGLLGNTSASELEDASTPVFTSTQEQLESDEDDDDENVYRSFKESLMMLRTEHHLRLKSPSLSPAISLRSVITELEEDEEDLPPDEVDLDLLHSTTEDEEGEEEGRGRRYATTTTPSSSDSFSHSYLRHVPKSPVKVRVKVEKATPDKDDNKVKVTVHFEDEYESERSEDVEEDASATTSTAETVRQKSRQDRSSYDTSEDEESLSQNTSDSEQGEEDENSLSEYESDRERSVQDKTESESLILTTNTSSTNPVQPSDGSGSHSKLNAGGPSTSYSSMSTTQSNEEKTSGTKSNEGDEQSNQTTSSQHSSNSSRSQSARASPTRRASARHKMMYSVGDKIRSLSARMRALPPPPIRQETFTLHSLSEDDGSEVGPSLSKTNSTASYSDNEYHTAYSKLSRFATFTIPDRASGSGSELPPIPVPVRSHSASFARNRQFSAALRQLSHGNIRKAHRSEGIGFPPITSSKSSSESSNSSSGSLSKPRPLLRNLTYTICSLKPSTEEDEEEGSREPIDLSMMRRLEETAHAVQQFPQEVESRHLLFSETAEFDSIYSIGNMDQQKYNDLIALSRANKEHQESFLFPPLNWKKQVSDDTSTEQQSLKEPLFTRSSTSSASSSTSKERKVKFERDITKEEDEEDAVNKDYLTYSELMRERLDDVDEMDYSKDRLKKFALAKIRKQIDKERKRLQSIELERSGDDDSDDDDEDDEEEEDESSEEDSKKKNVVLTKTFSREGGDTHIPMPSMVITRVGDSKTEEPVAKEEAETDDIPMIINKTEEGDHWSWGRDMKKDFENETKAEQEDDPTIISISPRDSRPDSAESGYRAMPPSRATSMDMSREESIDVEELEKEKDRLLQEWKKHGSAGPPPTANSGSAAASSSSTLPFHINTESNHAFDDADTPDNQGDLVQGNIDLTKEIPGEEKKIAAIWDEFNRDERSTGGMVDYDFSSLLDEMIVDVNNYKQRHSIGGGVNTNSSHSLQVNQVASGPPMEESKFDPSRKYQSLAEMVSLLSHTLRLVSSETLEDHMASLISLVSTILKKVRKNKSEDDYIAQIACLSTIRVLCDRIQEMQSSQNLKYADLSWLFRILCKYSSDTDSKIRPEASFCLARLVKVAGPALVVRPIYFILVMESEGGGGKTTTGAKTKAAAIDTLTYAMLTFPKEDFHNLEEIAGWVCLAMLNEERRIRQSALECLAVISNHLGGRDKALPLFHTLFLKEELDHFSRSPSPESFKTSKTGKSGKSNKSGGAIPFTVSGTVKLLTGPGFPIAQPIDAITARLDKEVLPVPSTKGLIEYAVNVPTGKDLVLLMTHMLDKDDDEWDFSSSTDSLDSGKSNMSKRSSVTSIGFSDIDWTGEGAKQDKKGDENELISPDVAYILLGKGKVNKQEVVLLDTYKKEIIPEILEMLNNKKQGKSRNKKRLAKLTKNRKRRRRKGQRNRSSDDERPRPPIPTLSFDLDDGNVDESGSGEVPVLSPNEGDDEVFKDGGPIVVVDPPGQDETSLGTEEATQSSPNDAKS